MTHIAGITAMMIALSVIQSGSANINVNAAYDVPSVTHYISADMPEEDLSNGHVITEEDMRVLIEHYVNKYPNSALKGCEGAFIEASNLTGMDPIFFFSLAGIESGWGTSKPHVEQGNPYSMGMYGDGKHVGYKVGDSFYDGIVNGACYIHEHYYLNGQTTLEKMNHNGDHSYCAGDPSWEEQIAKEMRYCYKLIGK